MKKIAVIGLDCAAPELVFDRFKDKLPNLTEMASRGLYGGLESSDPPITIPAWMVMVTGKSPGELGLYGFRHRRGNSYDKQWIATSNRVRDEKIWDILGKMDKKSILIGVPPSYPVYPLNGDMVGCFITPSIESQYTFPKELEEDIERLVGEYMVDVEFRIDDKESICDEVYEMTEKRFKVINYLIENREWEFLMFVEIGLDRMHHAFWRYFDESHHLYEPGTKFETVIEDYYIYLDNKIGKLLDRFDDDTRVLVVSDHGGKPMKGCFCVNDWLIDEGLLKLKEEPREVSRLNELQVDWEKTLAWGWGGYYSRIFLNVKGREEKGTIEPRDYERVRDKIAKKLGEIKGPNNEEWHTKVLKPEEIFPVVKGNPPDLMVYFDDLCWRSAGTLGHGTKYLRENDTGPDDAVHDKMGMYIYYDPSKDLDGKERNHDILDVAPTIMRSLGLTVPSYMAGNPITDGT